MDFLKNPSSFNDHGWNIFVSSPVKQWPRTRFECVSSFTMTAVLKSFLTCSSPWNIIELVSALVRGNQCCVENCLVSKRRPSYNQVVLWTISTIINSHSRPLVLKCSQCCHPLLWHWSIPVILYFVLLRNVTLRPIIVLFCLSLVCIICVSVTQNHHES